MARYTVEITFEVEMEIDPEVIALALTEEWRSEFYQLANEADVLEMLAYNIAIKDRSLSHLDGWADREDSQAVVIRDDMIDFVVTERPS